MLMLWRCVIVAGLVLPRLVLGQVPDGVPPEPAHDADLPALAAWIERWLPVVGATTYANIDSTADFYARSSDSVIAARLEGCTLVLHERYVSITGHEPSSSPCSRRAVRDIRCWWASTRCRSCLPRSPRRGRPWPCDRQRPAARQTAGRSASQVFAG